MTKECTIQPQLEGLGYQALAVEARVLNRLPGSFILTHARQHNEAKKNCFIGTDNYRGRILKKPAEKLGLAKLNIRVLQRTMDARESIAPAAGDPICQHRRGRSLVSDDPVSTAVIAHYWRR